LSKIIAQPHPTDEPKEPVFGMPRRCAVGDVVVELGPVLASFMPPNDASKPKLPDCRWCMHGRQWAHIAKTLNNAMNNPIVLALALAAVVLAFAIHVFVY
jgi:multisubunit Na+/H+ antiporter MnhC subunit